MEFEIVEWANKIIERIKLKIKPDLQPALLVGYIDADGAIKRLNIDTFVVDPGGGAGIMKVAPQGQAAVQQSSTNDRLSHYEQAETILGVRCYPTKVPIDGQNAYKSTTVAGDGANNKDVVINSGSSLVGFSQIYLYMDTSAGVPKAIDVAVKLYVDYGLGEGNTRIFNIMPATATTPHRGVFRLDMGMPVRIVQASFMVPANGDLCMMTGIMVSLDEIYSV